MTDAASPRVLIVDDDPFVGEMLRDFLQAADLNATWFDQPVPAFERAVTGEFDVILLDVMMPGMDGLTFLRKIKEAQPAVEVVMLTARQEMTLLDRAVKLQAFDYLVKPTPLQKLIATVKRAMTCRMQKIAAPSAYAPVGSVQPEGFLVAGNESARLLAWARAAAPYCATALIQGGPGSGKKHLVRVLHAASGRAADRLFTLDLDTVLPEQQEPELLGGLLHWKHTKVKVGAIKRADGGTLLLQNIERLVPSLQRRLVALFDSGQLDDPPSIDEDFLDVKIIATTAANLAELAARETFSPDLLRKLTLVSATIPDLASRIDEVLPFANHFLAESAKAAGKTLEGWNGAAERALMSYPWPGNVAELKSASAYAARGATASQATPADLPEAIRSTGSDAAMNAVDKFLKS